MTRRWKRSGKQARHRQSGGKDRANGLATDGAAEFCTKAVRRLTLDRDFPANGSGTPVALRKEQKCGLDANGHAGRTKKPLGRENYSGKGAKNRFFASRGQENATQGPFFKMTPTAYRRLTCWGFCSRDKNGHASADEPPFREQVDKHLVQRAHEHGPSAVVEHDGPALGEVDMRHLGQRHRGLLCRQAG